MTNLNYYISMEFYSYLKSLQIPILCQNEFNNIIGPTFNDIDYIINLPNIILTFKLAFKNSNLDLINENETSLFINATKKLSETTNKKCSGYFIGNVKSSDKAFELIKKIKQQYFGKLYFNFCCDANQHKLKQKIFKLLYSHHLYIYESNSDCLMIDG